MANASVRASLPAVLLQALDRIGFSLPATADKHPPFIPGDPTLPVEIFEEKQLKQVRFYLRQLPPEGCFGQVAWQFAAFFQQIPSRALPEVVHRLNHATVFAKAVVLPKALPQPLAGLFLNWYQGGALDEVQANTLAAQWRVDLYTSLELLEKLSRPAEAPPISLDSGMSPAKRLLH